MGEQLNRMKTIAQQSMKDNEFTIDDVRKELQRIRTERISAVLGLDRVEPIQITNSDAENMSVDSDFFRDWYESELNKLVDDLEEDEGAHSPKESLEQSPIKTTNKYEFAWNELSDESIKSLSKLVDDASEEKDMSLIKVKPIRPTKVVVNSEEEYRAFVDFAHGVNQPYDEIIEKVKERLKNHVRFPKRKRHEE